MVVDAPQRFARIVLANGGLPTGTTTTPRAFRLWRAFALESVVPDRAHRRFRLRDAVAVGGGGGLRRTVSDPAPPYRSPADARLRTDDTRRPAVTEQS